MTLPRSVQLKVRWAREHFDLFDQHHGIWRSNNPGHIARERENVPATEFRGKFRFDPPMPETFPLIMGDGIHNLRSALDHLACELHGLEVPSKSTTGPMGIEFPIFADRPRTEREKKGFFRKIDKMSPAARRQIIRLQPYHDGKNARYHPLWILHKLDIIDKHRQISIIGGRYSLPDFMKPSVIDPRMLWQGGHVYVPFDDGDEIRILGVDQDFVPDVKGNIAFQWDDGPTFIADVDKLAFIFNHVVDDVIPRFARFFE